MLEAPYNHTNTLPDSQRFYFDNYEYYNQVECLSDYNHDLSKLRFNSRRHSTTPIVLYDTHSSNYDFPSDKQAKPFEPRNTIHSQAIDSAIHKTLEDFFHHFAATYHEHNFSQQNPNQTPQPHYEIQILDFCGHFLLQEFEQTEPQDYEILTQMLAQLRSRGKESSKFVERLFELEHRVESNQLLERWFAFEQYLSFLVGKHLQAQHKQDKAENFYLFEYSLYFHWLIQEVCSGTKRSILLAAVPYTPALNLLIHPLTLPLAFSQRKGHPVRTLFLNLDGRQTLFNLKALRLLPQQVKYISVFKEPVGEDLLQQKLDFICDQFQIDADFSNLNMAHSQLLLREVWSKDAEATIQSTNNKISLYPLNSLHLRKAYAETHFGEPYAERKMPELYSSQCISWLWNQCIAGQVEEWHPELIIVSYNGSLQIGESDFEEIMRELSVLSDHRVVLFGNLSGMHTRPDHLLQDINEEEWSSPRVKMVDDFFSKYCTYHYSKINEEMLFSNLATFVKCSSGTTSMKKKTSPAILGKYILPQRQQYLHHLQNYNHLHHYNLLHNYNLPSPSPSPLTLPHPHLRTLLSEFAVREIKQNKKEFLWLERLVDQAVERLAKSDTYKDTVEIDMPSYFSQLTEKENTYRLSLMERELQAEGVLVHGQAVDVSAELMDYLQRAKQKLLLQHIEHYRYRRAYLGEEDLRGNRIRCFQFIFEDQEEVTLEQYSQVIIDDKKLKVFVVNYRESEEAHCILQGQINDRSAVVKVQKVNHNLDKVLKDLSIEEKEKKRKSKTDLRVNYSHCFLKDKLYLYWPQQWDLRLEIKRKLLGLSYDPPHVNFMLRLQYNVQDRCYSIDPLKWVEPLEGLQMLPRKACSATECADNRFYIFGGIYNGRLDYYQSVSSIGVVVLQRDEYSIEQLPKRKDRHLSRPNYLKPKMNYQISRMGKSMEEGSSNISISGGYGRTFTNYHILQSYEHYNVLFEFQGVKLSRHISKHARLVRLDHPLHKNIIGRFFVGRQEDSEQKFSDALKDWMATDSREASTDKDIAVVMEDQLRIYDFKTNRKRQYLFGWDKTIRSKIYVPHCWSPQLQIWSGNRLHILYTALRTERLGLYGVAHYMIPKEEDLVSLCLQEDKLWMLAQSPISNPLDSKSSLYTLYEGSLTNISFLMGKKQLLMNQMYEFKDVQNQNLLRFKTILPLEDKIYLVGGLSYSAPTGYHRDDFLLERFKDKFKLRVKRAESKQYPLELISPVVIKQQQKFLLYSLWAEQRPFSRGQGEQIIEQFWNIKIETMQVNESLHEETVAVGPLLIYHLDSLTHQITLRKTVLKEPKIVKIVQYNRFSCGLLREIVLKIIDTIKSLHPDKLNLYIPVLTAILTASNQVEIGRIIEEHHHRGVLFRDLLSEFDYLLEEGKEGATEGKQLIRDLRKMFRQLNKHLFQVAFQAEVGDHQLYMFVMEDRSSRKVKYIAIGPLWAVSLRFLRVRYRHQLSTCLNQSNEEQLLLGTNAVGYEEIVSQKDRGKFPIIEAEEQCFTITVSYKN